MRESLLIDENENYFKKEPRKVKLNEKTLLRNEPWLLRKYFKLIKYNAFCGGVGAVR